MAVHLNFGPPSIARKRCASCGEETLHKYGQCIHHDGVVHPSAQAGPQRPCYRLTVEMRREIRNRVHNGALTIQQAAREYGVVDQTIRNVVRGGMG